MSSRNPDSSEVSPALDAFAVRRMFWLPLWISVGVVLAALIGMLFVSWHSLERLAPIQSHLEHIERIQSVGLSMEQTLLKGLRGAPVARSELVELRDQVQEIARLEGALHPETLMRLKRVGTQLGDAQARTVDVLFEALAEIRQVLDGERQRHDWLLSQIGRDASTEIKLTLLLLLTGPFVFGVTFLFIRSRARLPLRAMEDLLARLARKDYRPVPESLIGNIDKAAHPAFNSYNELVARLQALEADHRDREQTLEQEVRQATGALLAQSRELRRAERLAAVGAVSAGFAHELRNPLAGIQMACGKLHRVLADTEHAARIAAVIDELKRINHLLTSQVDAARHLPEPLEEVAVGQLVNELLTLLRYQIPERIVTDAQIPSDLRCLLPAAGLRQALLNLVLNAVQAMPGEGCIQVVARLENGGLVVSVIDSGPGFPEDLLRAGIRPFATGRQGGTGLGLAMVRRFVRDQDGDLHLANQTPHGAAVTLRLPCRPHESTGATSHV
ncbi:integral membrane sensor signal transduction histidine kinase [Thiorhodococcus drewsii AZ1]|uniref:histidine kinase n=1 Tax=Thiorhodococcus drewsii AZ1 TaxID=765913 RepID=G2E4A0_9GAMM|nr:ATP-binding protein [Thiorhodococcus drewsii]EGV29827.1 integral membrane sensor signal transduction histidine kinase [Thiorhodococcus drewsii AZ1]